MTSVNNQHPEWFKCTEFLYLTAVKSYFDNKTYDKLKSTVLHHVQSSLLVPPPAQYGRNFLYAPFSQKSPSMTFCTKI